MRACVHSGAQETQSLLGINSFPFGSKEWAQRQIDDSLIRIAELLDEITELYKLINEYQLDIETYRQDLERDEPS